MSSSEGVTTMRISRETKAHIDSVRPYDTVSYDEFVREMTDVYAAVTGIDKD